MRRLHRSDRRPGTILPVTGIMLISLFGFVALAVDLGMLAVSRTQCQNGADVSALVGCRNLNNKPTSTNNNLAAAVAAAKTVATSNPHMSAYLTTSQVQKVEVGQYNYDPVSQTFKVNAWTDVTSSQTAAPGSGSWTAVRVTLNVTQPTYFMKVMGISSMPSGAVATAVHRPRDVAFVLDMTGSMAYACQFNTGTVTSSNRNQSMNPDTLVPTFGHYTDVQSYLIASSNLATSDGQAISRNNYCITTPGGPPIVRDFYFDPANVTTPATPAYPVTATTSSLKNAFHRWSPPESGGDSANYVGVTYDFTGYNADHNGTEASPKGPTPAPDTFGSMTDSAVTGVAYVGDRYRRADGSINKTNTSWATGSTATKAATTAIELLGYNVSGGIVRGGVSGTTNVTTNPTDAQFRDPVWEKNGYDLDIAAYRTVKGTGNPKDASYAATLLPLADRFQGFSMGPGYWGKTFYIWPPDPRFDASANLTSPNATKPGFDTSGKAMCDWRRHFFLQSGGTAFDPQIDNKSSSAGIDSINEALLNSATGGQTLGGTSFSVNYPAVLKWIKAGPQTLPANLRAGRVLFYSSIPDDVNTATGSAQQVLDKVFWKRYIDYALGIGSYTGAGYLYGVGDSWASSPENVQTGDPTAWNGPAGTWTPANQLPYMRYTDSPNRPRLHFWFGPLSMMDFIANATSGNWNPGTCHEAQCWQLKAGMNSALDDIRNNRPNDSAGLVDFAYSGASIYKNPRVAMGQSFTPLKNALFYPKSLLSAINAGDVTSELRPYDSSWNPVGGDVIPNANGSTDPNTGLAIAFNLLSPSSQLPVADYGTVKGRRGASKLIIFETDGVPNSYSTATPTKLGYDTYYASLPNGGSPGNGVEPSMSNAIAVVQQITKSMASSNTSGVDSGLSLGNAPAKVYPIGFGDIFDPVAAPSATFRPTALQFLANVAGNGNTGTLGASTIPSGQIIIGNYQNRIDTMRTCLEQIFQSGVAVTLIE